METGHIIESVFKDVHIVRVGKRLYHIAGNLRKWCREYDQHAAWVHDVEHLKASISKIGFDSAFGTSFFYFIEEETKNKFLDAVKVISDKNP